MKAQGALWLLSKPGLLPVAGTIEYWGFHVDDFEESPGFIYVDKGTVNLYSTSWKTVIYVNLGEEHIEVDSLRAYINHVDRLCSSVVIGTRQDVISLGTQ
jgi:hypothetical protein